MKRCAAVWLKQKNRPRYDEPIGSEVRRLRQEGFANLRRLLRRLLLRQGAPEESLAGAQAALHAVQDRQQRETGTVSCLGLEWQKKTIKFSRLLCQLMSLSSWTPHRYMVASRKLKAGDVIYRETALVTGPKQGSKAACLCCYNDVHVNSYRCPSCNFPCCSQQCCQVTLAKRLLFFACTLITIKTPLTPNPLPPTPPPSRPSPPKTLDNHLRRFSPPTCEVFNYKLKTSLSFPLFILLLPRHATSSMCRTKRIWLELN